MHPQTSKVTPKIRRPSTTGCQLISHRSSDSQWHTQLRQSHQVGDFTESSIRFRKPCPYPLTVKHLDPTHKHTNCTPSLPNSYLVTTQSSCLYIDWYTRFLVGPSQGRGLDDRENTTSIRGTDDLRREGNTSRRDHVKTRLTGTSLNPFLECLDEMKSVTRIGKSEDGQRKNWGQWKITLQSFSRRGEKTEVSKW